MQNSWCTEQYNSAFASTAVMAFLYLAYVVFVLYSGEAVYFSVDNFFAGFTHDRGKLNGACMAACTHDSDVEQIGKLF